jgi:hypothetical protein
MVIENFPRNQTRSCTESGDEKWLVKKGRSNCAREIHGRGGACLPEWSAGSGGAGWAKAKQVNPREGIYRWLQMAGFGLVGRKCPWRAQGHACLASGDLVAVNCCLLDWTRAQNCYFGLFGLGGLLPNGKRPKEQFGFLPTHRPSNQERSPPSDFCFPK